MAGRERSKNIYESRNRRLIPRKKPGSSQVSKIG
jgi:hypothetical protein